MVNTNPGKNLECIPASFLVLALIYTIMLNRTDVLVITAGMGLICYGLKMSVFNILLIVSMTTFICAFLPFGVKPDIRENFANNDSVDGDTDEKEDFEDEGERFVDEGEGFDDEPFEEEPFEEEPFEEDGFEGFANMEKKKENKDKKKKRPPPNNGDRAEPLVLGKKYKIPSEDDDEDYHLDAGTTFMNAYKSLNPDQISAMTKDTQDLINTQKQLMSTLNTLKPLITDGKQMMDTFQNYFGANGAEGMGNLSKMAEKFAGSK